MFQESGYNSDTLQVIVSCRLRHEPHWIQLSRNMLLQWQGSLHIVIRGLKNAPDLSDHKTLAYLTAA